MSPPTGTITFLFTNIEGSTLLWEEHPDAMREAITRHDVILRHAVETHGGYVFKTTGDGLAAAFAVAPEALAAAVEAQRTLLVEPWTGPAVIRSRIGLHTGAAELRDGDYFGPALNRCARLAAAAHGGQILLSDATQELCRDSVPAETVLTPLGEHRLRDLPRAEKIYQVDAAGLPSRFPPLRTLINPDAPTNLPRQLTSFVGGETTIAEVRSLLDQTRLLTLTGAGGSGKTRLSLQVAANVLDNFPDGVWQVELALFTDPGFVARGVASVLGVKEQTGQVLELTLVGHLKTRRTLLLLDNCEHLRAACAEFTVVVLRACPNVRILATSREALGVGGEQIYRVPSLSLPDPHRLVTAGNAGQYGAIQLFIERAQSVWSDFAVTDDNAPVIAQLCRRLDGIPLAIELAAARVRSLSVDVINTRLHDRFRLLTGGDRAAVLRQQTLRALVDWSFDLLTEPERTLFARLSIFVGGWTLPAAEAVCAFEQIEADEVLDLLTSLVDKSLVLSEDGVDGANRYRMLETLRQYGAEKLSETGEAEAVATRHCEFFLDFVEAVEPKLRTSEQRLWLGRLETEDDNLRAALDCCSSTSAPFDPANALIALRFAGALARFWHMHSHLAEARQRLDRALAPRFKLIAATAESDLYRTKKIVAHAVNAASIIAFTQVDHAAARTYIDEGLRLSTEIGDNAGIVHALNTLGGLAYGQQDYSTAQSLFEDALRVSREIGKPQAIAQSLMNLGSASQMREDFPRARACYEESLTLRRALGDRGAVAYTLINLAHLIEKQGDHERARVNAAEGLTLLHEVGDRFGVTHTLGWFGWYHSRRGDHRAAVALIFAMRALRDSLGANMLAADVDVQSGVLAEAGAALGEAEFDGARAVGAALSWEQAVELALR